MSDLRIVTAPTAEPVTLAEACNQVRQEPGVDDDRLLSHITAAREAAESLTGRAWTDAVYEYRVDAFASCIALPVAPVRGLLPVVYRDGDSALQQFGGTAFLDDNPTAPVVLLRGAFPATDGLPGAVQLRFRGGHGAGGVPVPRSVAQAILLMVGHLYANREEVSTSQTHALERGFEALLWPHRRNLGV